MEVGLCLGLLCNKEMRSVMNDISRFWYWIFVGCETVAGSVKIKIGFFSTHFALFKLQTTSLFWLMALSANKRLKINY